jgi:hypothetical protein
VRGVVRNARSRQWHDASVRTSSRLEGLNLFDNSDNFIDACEPFNAVFA